MAPASSAAASPSTGPAIELRGEAAEREADERREPAQRARFRVVMPSPRPGSAWTARSARRRSWTRITTANAISHTLQRT